jgi:hypothetical protein
MKIPSMLIPTIIGIIFGIISWLGIGWSFHFSVVVGIIIGFLAGMVETIFKGQD